MVRRAECFSKGVLMKMKAIVVALPIAMILATVLAANRKST
jgi:hypothetical protein